MVESASGCHLGVPNPGSTAVIPASGVLRVPDDSACYSFGVPGGMHRFLAFVLVAEGPPAISGHAGNPLPLSDPQLQSFAQELGNQSRSGSWWLDQLNVFVS
jgi:hypothetical protein